jgi:glycosyltransferase involved in cell wall biosynthesis
MIREGNEFPRFLESFRQKALQAQTPVDQAGYTLVYDTLNRLVEEGMQDYFHCDVQAMMQAASARLGFDLAQVVWGDPPFFYMAPAKEISSRKRLALVQALQDVAVVDIFGDPEWEEAGLDNIRFHPRTDYYTQTPDVYRQSRINLNIEKVYNTSSLNPRVIDAMMCGGFVLTEQTDELGEWFEAGKELEVFDSVRELQEKVRYYLEHHEQRARIAAQGCARVRSELTLRGQVQKLLDIVSKHKSRTPTHAQ